MLYIPKIEKNYQTDFMLTPSSLNDILKTAFFPVWLYIVMMVSSFGLLGLLILPIQKARTKKAAKALGSYVIKKNKEFVAKKKNIRFEIPRPSINNVIINVLIR